MSARRFEQETVRKAAKGRDERHESRWQTRGGRSTTEYDIEADDSMSQIYRDKRKYEQYKKVGYHEKGDRFLAMTEKWEKDEDLSDDERDMREDVRSEFVTRMGIVKACEKLLTKDVFKGVADEDHVVNRLVGELGADRALLLIRPRLLNLVGEENGTDSLNELRMALKDMHGVYKTNGFNKVNARIDKYQSQYGINASKWAEIQSGGNWMEISERAYGEFAKQHGWFGRKWHAIPHMWRAAKIGFAGWREERNGAMQQLRETRSRALDVLGLIMGEDFQKLIDKEIKSGKPAETDRSLKQQEQKDAEAARGIPEGEMSDLRDSEWSQYIQANPAAETPVGYDDWLQDEFIPGYETRMAATGGTGWFARMLTSLFSIRAERLARPAGV